MKLAIDTCAVSNNGDIDFSKFEELGEVVYFANLNRAELFALVEDIDAIFINVVDIDRELLDHAKKLKYVGAVSTGYNSIDIVECAKRGIVVANVPQYSTYAVAQHTFALLLTLYNQMDKYPASVRDGDWIRSESFSYFPWDTHEIFGKTFGVFGYGNIGKTVANIAHAFGARVIVCSQPESKDCPYEQVDFDTLLKESDILSLHCPLTSQTRNIINADSLSKMKDSSVLVNTARGGLIDEEALFEALESGKLYGACLDNMVNEPMKKDCKLRTCRNTIISPHIAWVAYETRTRLISITYDNFIAFLNGKPQNKVN